MGDSHYKSNMRAKTGAEVITGFNRIATIAKIVATDFIANNLASVPTVHGTTKVIAGSYIRIGTNKYLMSTTSAAASTVSRQMYDVVGTPYRGSLSFGAAVIWLHKNNFADSNATAVAISSV